MARICHVAGRAIQKAVAGLGLSTPLGVRSCSTYGLRFLITGISWGSGVVAFLRRSGCVLHRDDARVRHIMRLISKGVARLVGSSIGVQAAGVVPPSLSPLHRPSLARGSEGAAPNGIILVVIKTLPCGRIAASLVGKEIVG